MIVVIGLLSFLGALLVAAGFTLQSPSDVFNSWIALK